MSLSRGVVMLHRGSIVVLVASLLLAGSISAAPRRAISQLQIYLPQIYTSRPCETNPVLFAPLVLPARRLAFWEGGALWLFNPTSGSVERLAQDVIADAFAWSPDGRRIAFSSTTSTFKTINIVRLADHQVTTLIRWADGHSPGNLTWSPDGQRIAFDLAFYDGTEETSSIMVMQANGTQVKQLSAVGYDFAPAWSPDGRHVAFVSLHNPDRKGTLVLVQPDGRNPTQITTGLSLFSRLAWSPDGMQIAFNGECIEGQVPGGYGLFVISVDGVARTPIAYIMGAGSDSLGSWSPDGRQIVYEQTHGHGSNIILLNLDGSGYNILPITGSYPTWAPR
jgi:Tol biopolymer transport system component